MVMQGDGSSRGGARSQEFQALFRSVVERGKTHELQGFKELLIEALNSGERKGYSELLAEKFRSRDPEEWRVAIKILGELMISHSHILSRLDASERFNEFLRDWNSRPHFANGGQIRVEVSRGTPTAFSVKQNMMPELLRMLADNPCQTGWRSFSAARRSRGEITRIETLPQPEGGEAVYANWKKIGIRIRFDAQGHLQIPIEVRRPYTDEDFSALRNPPPPNAILVPAPLEASSYAPEGGETPSLWAMRLLEASRAGDPVVSVKIAQEIDRRLRDPQLRPLALEVVDRLIALTSGSAEGQGIVARRYPVPGLKEPLTIVSLPSTFLPEQWSRVFAEGIVSEFRRAPQRVDRAIEIGSGTGWMSVLLAKLGMASSVLAVDYNPHAQVVGRLNAALNGVEGLSFQQGDLLSSLPQDLKAELIVACLPQVPKAGSIENLRAVADYYPDQGRFMDRYGLGLIDRALEESRRHLSQNGRILFNLGGRPGRAVLEDMLARRGFHPTIRYAQQIEQDPRTDFSALAEHEEQNQLRFEFFLGSDPLAPVSAREAVGQAPVYHMLYLTEGRPYPDLTRQAAQATLAQPARWSYTSEPGSEHEALRELLGQELSRQWGTKISPEVLFLGPSAELLTAGLLRILMPPRGRVLALGSAEDFGPEALRGLAVDSSPPDLGLARTQLEGTAPSVLLLNLPRDVWADRAGLRGLLTAAAERQIHVVIREDQPAPYAGSAHPLAELLAEHGELLEFTHIVQSVDRRFESPALPAGAAILGNSALRILLARYGELTYSRASTLTQGVYSRFLGTLVQDRLDTPPQYGQIEPMLTVFTPSAPRLQALESTSAFDSDPSSEHPDPIDMSFGESQWRTPRIGARWAEAFDRPYPELYAETQGTVSEYLRQSRGVDFTPEQIVLGAGVQPLIGDAILALQRLHPGKSVNVALPRPSYGIFFPTIELAGARRVEVLTTQEDRFLLQAGSFATSLNGNGLHSSVNAALVNEPSNPSGQYYTPAQLKTLAQAVLSTGGYLLFDDIFGMLDFGRIRTRRPPSLQALSRDLGPQLAAFGGVSKEFAAGGLRFGFAATRNAPWAEAMRESNLARPDALGMIGAQELMGQWVKAIPEHGHYLNSRAFQLEQFFREKNIPVKQVQGGFSLLADLRSLYGREFRRPGKERVPIDPRNLHELLYREAGIKVHSDQWAGVNGHYRFVFSIDRLEEAIERLRLFFRSAR
jgi:aspartate/methionine/tyrosine aminotransferase/methylase of polypeptide subunit release factors